MAQVAEKRLPACDLCKSRRVKCFPVLPPGSCSSCKAKGLACTTTPVVKKKPKYRTGKRIEIAKQKYGATSYASASTPGATPPSGSASPGSSSIARKFTIGFTSSSSGRHPAYTPYHIMPACASTTPPKLRPLLPAGVSALGHETDDSLAIRDTAGSSQSLDNVQYYSYAQSPLPYLDAESGLIDTEFSGTLLADLLYLYTRVPRWRFIPCVSLISSFELSGRRLAALPAISQTLVLTIAALTARLSSNPALFGGGRTPPALSSVYFEPRRVEAEAVEDWGRRREWACEELRGMASERAWRERVVQETSPAALAVCFILGFLADNVGSTADRRTWSIAFVHQLREAYERRMVASVYGPDIVPGRVPDPRDMYAVSRRIPSLTLLMFGSTFSPPELFPNVGMWDDPQGDAFAREPHKRHMGLRWSVIIMREAVMSATRGESCPFTINDETMLSGQPPPSPEEVFAGAFDDVPLWDFGSFLVLVRPFTYRVTQLALESTQWQMRRLSGLPFSLSLLEKYLANLSPLHALLSLIQARYSGYFSPDVLNARYDALQQHTPDMPYEERNARFWAGNRNTLYAGRVLLMAMKSALGALSVPVYLDLKARLQRVESGNQSFLGGQQPGQTKGGDNVQLLREVFGRLRRALVPYAREVVSAIQEAANLGWIMHLGNEPIKVWCGLVLDSVPIEAGGEDITRVQRVESLKKLLNIFKMLAWSWPRVFDDPLVRDAQQIVEEHTRHSIDGSSSAGGDVPRFSFGEGLLTSSSAPQWRDINSTRQCVGMPPRGSMGTPNADGSVTIWPAFLVAIDARLAECQFQPLGSAAESSVLRTVHDADSIPAMPWPRLRNWHSIPPTLGLPDVRQVVGDIVGRYLSAGGGHTSGAMPSTAPQVTSVAADAVPTNDVTFYPASLDMMFDSASLGAAPSRGAFDITQASNFPSFDLAGVLDGTF